VLDVTEEHEREAASRAAIAAERAAREAADAERRRLDEIVAQIPAPVAVYEGRELRFRALSAAYQRIIGGRDVVGRPIREALPGALGRRGRGRLLRAAGARVRHGRDGRRRERAGALG
jgi:PAS domain-containing protein